MKLGYSIISLGFFVLVAQGTPVGSRLESIKYRNNTDGLGLSLPHANYSKEGKRSISGDIMSVLQYDLEGQAVVGEDGYVRSFDRNGNIIDFAKLSRPQLTSFMQWPLQVTNKGRDGVEGRNVELERDFWNPADNVHPELPTSDDSSLQTSSSPASEARRILSRQLEQHSCIGIPCLVHARCRMSKCTWCVASPGRGYTCRL
ncbi:hypothetical protein ACJ72_01193 [Emergomyces africanus]|uniref:Uncharacterized protein n=1 Tax=Emergomyces africanus TaxID=1955775 RepID=A0A1B7P620_9EURO|nr:hypothetical protein ACJ72_01193 [Emergomyces africanus]